MRRGERGFTLVELLVGIGIFAAVSVGFYTVMFTGVRGSGTARDVAGVAEEARLGFNRMVRDTREAQVLTAAEGTYYTIEVDFGAGVETFTYLYHAPTATIRLKQGGIDTAGSGEILVAGAEPLAAKPVFAYSSSRLEWDWGGDGVTDLADLEAASSHGVTLAANKLLYLDNVTYAFRVTSGGSSTEFYGRAQLRNRR